MSVAVVIPSLLRIHRQLRILDQAYMGAETKKQVQSAVEAKLHELQAIHDLLPSDVRDKSWILLIRGYTPWGGDLEALAVRFHGQDCRQYPSGHG